MKLFFNRQQTIKVGDETVVTTTTKPATGTPVTFFSQMGQHLGTKPIARGVVVGACENEPGAPVTPTKTGQPPANAWRFQFRVKVTKIEE